MKTLEVTKTRSIKLRAVLALSALLAGACATAAEKPDEANAKPAASDAAKAKDAKDEKEAKATEAKMPAVPTPPAAPKEPPPLAGEEILAAQPALSPLADFAAPVPKVITLPSGLRILIVSRPGTPLETLSFVVKRGATADPEGRAGLAALSAAMLEAGAGGKSQSEIAAAIDTIGATLHAAAVTDGSFVNVSGMAQHAPEMIALLGDIALRPNLAEAEWTKLQTRRVAELKQAMADPGRAAALAFAASIYGDTPLGRSALGTPASVEAASLADVKKFRAAFEPSESALLAVGGAPEADIVAALTRAFGGWKGSGKKTLKTASPGKSGATPTYRPVVRSAATDAVNGLPASERPRFVFVDFKGRPQTVLRMGEPAVPRSSPDALALRLFNSILGGSFTSRLNQNLREAHGYTYGAFTNFAFGRGPGPFAVQTSVKTNVTGAALAETIKELDHALQEPFSDVELAKGKALIAYGLVEALQHTDGIAGVLQEIFFNDLPLDEYATMVPRLRALTTADVLAAAKRALNEGQMTIAMAGDEAVVLPQLAAAGVTLPAPEVRNASGEKLAANK